MSHPDDFASRFDHSQRARETGRLREKDPRASEVPLYHVPGELRFLKGNMEILLGCREQESAPAWEKVTTS